MKAILEAIVACDPEKARAAAVEHVRLACKAATEIYLSDQTKKTTRVKRARPAKTRGV
jgi:DNA-binding GntR family transcriptional regulator